LKLAKVRKLLFAALGVSRARISAVSLRGDMRFMTVTGRMNAAKFIEFLQRLMKGANRPVFLLAGTV
jgi:hypothetical protein